MKNKIPYNRIARYITGNCSPREAEEVASWIEESKENQKLFNELYEIWENTGQLNEIMEYNAEKALSHVSSKLSGPDKKNEEKKLYLSTWLKIAAGFFIVAALSFIVIYQKSKNHTKMILYTSGNEVNKILLSDGSTVWLNKYSSLEYPDQFKKNYRDVTLKGEAFFEVAKDKDKPFIISTSKASIRVLGTSFNVMARENAFTTTVSVKSGKVELTPNSNIEMGILLEKGEMGTLENKTQKIKKDIMKDENTFSWKTGILSFKDKSFKESMEDIAEYYQKKIVVKDTVLYNQKFNGYFEKQPFDVILEILRMNKDLQIKDSSGIIVITKN